MEAQFATRNITSQRTRFDHVVAALSNEFATEVRDIILSPPEVDAYSKLKDLLIKQTAASERKRLQLLSLRRNSATGSLHKSYGRCSSSWVTLLAPNRTTLSYGKYFSSGSPAMFAWCWPPLGTLFPSTPWRTWPTRCWKLPHPQCRPLSLQTRPQPHPRLPLPARKWPSSGQRSVSYANSSPHCSSPPVAPVAHTPVPTPAPVPPPLVHPLASAGTTGALETRPTNAPPLGPGREMGRPIAIGDGPVTCASWWIQVPR